MAGSSSPWKLWLANPRATLSDHTSEVKCPHRRLSVQEILTDNYRNGELAKWVIISPYSGTFTEGKNLSLKGNIEVFEVGNLGGGRASEKSKCIQSNKGRRLELKEYHTGDLLSIANG